MIEIDFYRSCVTSLSYPFNPITSHHISPLPLGFPNYPFPQVPQRDTHTQSGDGGVVSFNLEIPQTPPTVIGSVLSFYSPVRHSPRPVPISCRSRTCPAPFFLLIQEV